MLNVFTQTASSLKDAETFCKLGWKDEHIFSYA